MARKFRSMTLGDLQRLVADAIEDNGTDMLVGFSCNYGDYSKTMQVLPFDENDAEVKEVEGNSGYSQSGFAVAERDEDECCPDCESTNITVDKDLEKVKCNVCPWSDDLDPRDVTQEVFVFTFDS